MSGDPKIKFGKRLAACRRAKGWSQERLALVEPSHI
jgi:ribosome-binding protein aMBF1 (putative translation factor)